MKAFGRFFSQLAFYTISIGLLVYASSRSLHFIQSTLDVDNQILGMFALLATSGGIIGWMLIFIFKADGIIQKGIALLMVLIDFLGEAALFTMDTLQQAGTNGLVQQLTQSEMRTIFIGMSFLIAINIFAGIAYHLGNIDIIRQVAEGAQKDILFFKSLAEIEKNSDNLARNMAPEIANEWKTEFAQNYGSASKLGLTNGKSETTSATSATFTKPQMKRFNFPLWKKAEKPTNVSPLSFLPFIAKQQFTVGKHVIKHGEQLEAAMTENDTYILRTPGTNESIGEVHAAQFIQLFTGNELTIPSGIPAMSSNGYHPSSPS